ncbi:rhamnogalacturonan acetylesterase [Streptomyces coryli]|uniref:rhamnogalacturonan acetylesterase n=1 Tax=Streptomyces coryli TaxID=1128680 RepID=UPI0023F07CCA|nr:rhamnogalacturonan acetylesterase [Streptomyces coryli]
MDAPWAARGRPRTVHIAGDSTAAAKPASAAPMAGWGMALPLFLGRDLAVANHARDGRSSLSFLAEGRLDALVDTLRPGDLVLIQFGHNDQKAEDPTRYTDPATTYRHHLLRLVAAVRAARAVPVLLTPVERRSFGPDGSAQQTHGPYAETARSVAAEEQVALIDVQAASHALWQQLGPEASKDAFLWLGPGDHPNHPRGAQDDTHVRSRGAIEIARLVARGLRAAGLLAPADVRRLEDEDIPESGLTWEQEPPR